MPTTYPGIPVLTDGPGGRQIIPLSRHDANGNKIMLGYSLRWTPQDETGLNCPDGIWDAYVYTNSGADKLVGNGVSRHESFRLIDAALKQSAG